MRQRKPKLEVKNPRLSPAIEISNEDEKMLYLVGWPGYRTTRDKSGLGYIETQAELAHMQGLMLRWLFTGKFRTHNPFYLFFMFLFGLLWGVVPLLGIAIEVFFSGNYEFIAVFLLASPYIVSGIALLVNVLLSLWDWNGPSITGD